MNAITITEVQRINTERANRWHGGDFHEWSGLEWAGALCGEAGEAANVAKKLRRIETGRNGNECSEHRIPERTILVAKLAAECADVFLYLALLAARYDIDLSAAIVEKFNSKSVEMGFPERLGEDAYAVVTERPPTPARPWVRGTRETTKQET